MCRESIERMSPPLIRHGDTAERGAALVEYAILILLIAAVCILGVTLLGNSTADFYNSAAESIKVP